MANDTEKILTNDSTQQAVYEGYARYEIEGSIHARGGKDRRFVPGSYQDHHDQTKTQELVHDTEPGYITLLLASYITHSNVLYLAHDNALL